MGLVTYSNKAKIKILKVKKKIINKYKPKKIIWVQEEPENMGAAGFMMRKFPDLGSPLKLVSRKESSSPSTGFSVMHKKQQEELIRRAFA